MNDTPPHETAHRDPDKHSRSSKGLVLGAGVGMIAGAALGGVGTGMVLGAAAGLVLGGVLKRAIGPG